MLRAITTTEGTTSRNNRPEADTASHSDENGGDDGHPDQGHLAVYGRRGAQVAGDIHRSTCSARTKKPMLMRITKQIAP